MLSLDADLVIQSWHKTLPALTGSSCLLIGENYRGNDVNIALDILQSTSPSYLMLSALESAAIYMAEHGESDIAASLDEIALLNEEIFRLETIQALQNPRWHQDPFKLNLSSRALSGAELAQKLAAHQIYVEMSEANSVLLLLPLRAGGRWRAHRPLPLREDQGMRSPRRRRRRWCACGSVRPPQNRTLRGQRMHPDSLHACDGHVPP